MRAGVVLGLAMVAAVGGTAAAQKKPTVAVLYFDYDGKTDELIHLRKGLTQMLVSDLSGQPSYDVVERTRLEQVLEELELNQTRVIDRAAANRIGKLLGARYLVVGGFFDFRGSLRIDARVVQVETGKVVKSVGASRKLDEFLGLEQEVAGGLGKFLALELEAPAAPKAAKAAAAPAPKKPPKQMPARVAARYGKALDAIDRGDRAQAKVELQSVVTEQPDFELAAADLARMVQ